MPFSAAVRAVAVCLAVVLSVARATQASAQVSDVSVPPAASAQPAPIARPIAQDIVALQTTARLDRSDWYFRLTHRFTRDLRGPLDELAKSAFGLDDGAIIGFEVRFAPASNLQIGAHRSMLFKTIQMLGRYDAMTQKEDLPIGLSVLAAVEGTNNLRAQHAQSLGLVLSRTFGDRLAIYLSPVMVWNSQMPAGVTGHEGHDHGLPGIDADEPPRSREQTFLAGIGGRLRLRPTVFLAGEFIPRIGFTPGAHQWAAGIEKRTDGHQFQLNVSNSFNTTHAQIARGGQPGNVYLGFNLARRF